MQTHADKNQENKSKAVANAVSQKKSNSKSAFQLEDNRPEALQMRKLQEMANNHAKKNAFQFVDNRPEAVAQRKLQERPIHKKLNNTGLPDNLKSGIENLSGYSMDDVKVHYNSDKPAQLNAHAYAQGTDIHITSGQEKHLPHEAWHVVQQKQERVKPTMQMKGKVNINDDAGLEKEADQKGRASFQHGKIAKKSDVSETLITTANKVVQRIIGENQDKTYVLEKSTNTIYYARWNHNLKVYELESIDDGLMPTSYLMTVAPDNDDYIVVDKDKAESIHHMKSLLMYLRNFYEKLPLEILDDLFLDITKKYRSFDDSKDYLNAKISHYLKLIKKKQLKYYGSHDEEGHKLQVIAKYPRVFIKGIDKDSKLNLAKLNKKEHDHGVDLSYRNHRDAMDIELDNFLPKEKHDTKEYRKLYEESLKDKDKVIDNEKDNSSEDEQQMNLKGGFPLTSSTLDLMSEYSNMHYRHKLKKPNHTSSTRAYEAEFLKRMKKGVNAETMAALNLPPCSNADPKQECMLNTFGAALDVNTPPKRNPIGKGKIYKTIYKHFQRTLEIINHELDSKDLKNDPDNFELRTRTHIEYLEDNFLIGMKQNEEERASNKKESNPNWETVSKMIDTALKLIIKLAKGAELKKDLNSFFEEHSQKWLEVLGTVLGLYYKTIKRLILSRAIVEYGSEKDILILFDKLSQLLDAEKKINKQLHASKTNRKSKTKKGNKRKEKNYVKGKDKKKRKTGKRSGANAAQEYDLNFIEISGRGFNCYLRSIITGLNRSGALNENIETAVDTISDHLENIGLRVGLQMIDVGGLVAAEARRAIMELYNIDVGVTIVTWNHDQSQYVRYVANNGSVSLTLFSTPGHFDLLEG